MNKILFGIMYAIALILFLGLLSLIHYIQEKKEWNNGKCKCGGKFTFFVKDHEHCYKVYKCNKCKKQIELTWVNSNNGDEYGRSKND